MMPHPVSRNPTSWLRTCLLLALGLSSLRVAAAPALGEWKALFQGIDLVVGTNTPDANFKNQHVATILRVDLQAPGIQLVTSPRRNPDFIPDLRETDGMTVSRFVQIQGVQVAINGGFFSPAAYYLPEKTAMNVDGLGISGGQVVSAQGSRDNAAVAYFTASNQAGINPTNWPAMPTAGIETAVAGAYPLVINGVNLGKQYVNLPGFIHDPNPRTALGLSGDRRYLYLLTIDGRQPGYSVGADDSETAGWLLFLGATDGINLDGGGSTTMAYRDSTGKSVRLNRSSAVADSGKERTLGSHFGVRARALVDFVDNVRIQPDDTAATIAWTTPVPADTQVEYGPTPDLGQVTPLQPALSTSHAVLLTGLTPGSEYYFRAVSQASGVRHTSTDRVFATVSYVTTESLVPLTASWRYATANQDGKPWTTRTFNDSTWAGPSPALLWNNARFPAGTGEIPDLETSIPLDDSTSFPFLTYYFRTRFNSGPVAPGVQLRFRGRIDDGAVIHLNGRPIHRLRMDAEPAPILNDSLASAFPCDGDATCEDFFEVAGALGELAPGDNVLSVEVHNYNPRSADVTFGLEVTAVTTLVVPPVLTLVPTVDGISLQWSRGGFALQEADSSAGPWVDVAGPVVESPHLTPVGAVAKFYRLRR